MNYADMFRLLQPGFFEKPYIRGLPKEEVYEEQIMDLHGWEKGDLVPCPEQITFGMYKGDLETLQAAVREVDDDWVQWFRSGDHVYCAFDGDNIASFCLLDTFGEVDGRRIGAPGCVGTVPAYRRQGIGLRMIQNATEILQKQGYDLSWIHYTGVGHWYARLGYKTVIRWNSDGMIWHAED